MSIIVLIGLSTACELPKGGDHSSPEEAYYAALAARASGEADRLWNALHPETRSLFDRWVEAEKRIYTIVRSELPAKHRAAALATLSVHELADGKALFARLLADDAAPSGPLAMWARLGAFVRSVDTSGDSATVRTWGGNDMQVRAHDGAWYAVLPKPLEEQLEASTGLATRNLRKVEALAAALNK